VHWACSPCHLNSTRNVTVSSSQSQQQPFTLLSRGGDVISRSSQLASSQQSVLEYPLQTSYLEGGRWDQPQYCGKPFLFSSEIHCSANAELLQLRPREPRFCRVPGASSEYGIYGSELRILPPSSPPADKYARRLFEEHWRSFLWTRTRKVASNPRPLVVTICAVVIPHGHNSCRMPSSRKCSACCTPGVWFSIDHRDRQRTFILCTRPSSSPRPTTGRHVSIWRRRFKRETALTAW
jgi:hypothetical protein